MATELQQATAGYVMVFGPPDATLKVGTTGADASATAFAVMITSASFSKTAQRIKTQNTAGETVNITTFNKNVTATLTVRPIASSRANAITSAATMPNPGDCLYSITNTPASWTDGTEWSDASTGREWSVVSCNRSGDNGNLVDFTLVLEREGAITSYNQVT